MTLDRLADYSSMTAACKDLAPNLNIGVELTGGVLREQGIAVTSRSYRAWKTRAVAGRTYSDAVLVEKSRELAKRDSKGRQRPGTEPPLSHGWVTVSNAAAKNSPLTTGPLHKRTALHNSINREML